MHGPRDYAAVSAASDQLLGDLGVEVLDGLPAHAVDRVGQITVLDVVEDLSVKRGYDFEIAI